MSSSVAGPPLSIQPSDARGRGSRRPAAKAIACRRAGRRRPKFRPIARRAVAGLVCTSRCCQRRWRAGHQPMVLAARPRAAGRDQPRRAVGGRPPIRAARASRRACPRPRPWARARLRDRPRDRRAGVVPADPGLVRRVVGRRAEVLDLGRSASAANPRANEAGAQNSTGSSADASIVTTRPSVGEPGRMSTATMNARPATTRISLPCGGSHWKCRPRTTPRAERDWLTCSNRVGRPRSAKAPVCRISANQPRSSLEPPRTDDQDLGDRGALDR